MTENIETTDAPTYAAGSWGDLLAKSTTLKARAGKATKQAGKLLWDGSKGAITEWIESKEDDPTAEGLYGKVIDALGRARKGDASKIKLVALAVVQHSLDLSEHDSLATAYGEARRLLQVNLRNESDDSVIEELTSAIHAPKAALSVDDAAAKLLAGGVDSAVVAIFDKLKELGGEDEAKIEAAYRAFLRAASTEVASRLKFVADQAAKAKAEAAEKVRAEKEAIAAERKAAREAKAKATPVKNTKKPAAKKSAPAKASSPKPTASKPSSPAKAAPRPVAAPAGNRPKPVRRPTPKA